MADVEGGSRFYSLLGLSTRDRRKEGVVEDARRAFRSKAKLLHPDRGGNENEFAELQRALEYVLKDLDAFHTTAPRTPQASEASSPSPRPQSINAIRSDSARRAGNAFYEDGKYQEALLKYSEALVWEPSDARSLSNRSATLLKLGRAKGALADALLASRLRPMWGKAYLRAGVALMEMGKEEDAMEKFRRAIECGDPGLDEALLALKEAGLAVAGKSLAGECVGHEQAVRGISIRSIGLRDLLASASLDGTVRLFDADSGESVTTLRNHSDKVTEIAWGHTGTDSAFLASGGVDKCCNIWEVEARDAGALVTRHTATLSGHTGRITSIRWTMEDVSLVSSSTDRSVRVWNRHGILIHALTNDSGAVPRFALSSSSRLIAAACNGGSARVWNAYQGTLQDFLPQEEGWACTHVVFTKGRTKSLLVTGNVNPERNECRVQAWDLDGNNKAARANGVLVKPNYSVDRLSGKITHLLATADENGKEVILILTTDGNMRTIEAESGSANGLIADLHPFHTPYGVQSEALAATIAPFGHFIATGGRDSRVRLWDLSSGTQLVDLAGHEDAVHALEWFQVSGTWMIASGDARGNIKMWRIPACHHQMCS